LAGSVVVSHFLLCGDVCAMELRIQVTLHAYFLNKIKSVSVKERKEEVAAVQDGCLKILG
jgi:hypothetical protein